MKKECVIYLSNDKKELFDTSYYIDNKIIHINQYMKCLKNILF